MDETRSADDRKCAEIITVFQNEGNWSNVRWAGLMRYPFARWPNTVISFTRLKRKCLLSSFTRRRFSLEKSVGYQRRIMQWCAAAADIISIITSVSEAARWFSADRWDNSLHVETIIQLRHTLTNESRQKFVGKVSNKVTSIRFAVFSQNSSVENWNFVSFRIAGSFTSHKLFPVAAVL